ncbi:MAG: acyltransferase family protein [Candidatus Methanomethylophilaceae archaeon]|nr:acyltransferase family protein [Candidatus Methanomethylophilaceae archaeon]
MDDCDARGRLDSLDILKGTIITAIVFVHIIMTRGGESTEEPSILMQYLYMGLMFFFVCSGYFYRPERGFTRNMKYRLAQLLLSLVICGAVLSLVLFIEISILWGMPDWMDLVDAFARSLYLFAIGMPMDDTFVYQLSGASMGYYYIWTMLWSFLIFYSTARFLDDDNRKIIAAIAVLLAIQCLIVEFLAIQVPFFFNLAPFGAALMFAGRLMAKYSVFHRIESCPRKKPIFWIVLVACAVAALILVIIFEPGLSWDQMHYGDYGWASVIPFFFEALPVIVVLVYAAMLLGKIPVLSGILMIAGKHSLGVLLLHSFVAKFIFLLFYEPVTDDWFPHADSMERLFVALAMYAIVLASCELYSRFMEKRCSQNPDS